MIISLTHLDKRTIQAIQTIGRMADRKKVSAYIVGGIVRDIVLKKKSLDLDVVIEGNAISFAKEFAQKNRAKILTHQPFGTAVVHLPNGVAIDFVMSRREYYPTPGSLPVVEGSDIMDDLFRRDFTINAMAININRKTYGQCFDPYGGLSDIKSKYIRVLHHDSFIDDPTRLLRAIRYANRLGFKLESETQRLMAQAVQKRSWLTVKPPRYMDEFSKLLEENGSVKAVEQAFHLGVLRLPLLSLATNKERQSIAKKWLALMNKKPFSAWDLKPTWLWLITINDQWRQEDLLLAVQGLQLPLRASKSLMQSMMGTRVLAALGLPHLSRWQVWQMLRDFDEHVLLWLYVQANPLVKKRLDQFINHDKHFQLSIGGDDLKLLGISDGISIKETLKGVFMLSINQGINNRAKQMVLAKQLGGIHAHGKN